MNKKYFLWSSDDKLSMTKEIIMRTTVTTIQLKLIRMINVKNWHFS